MYQVKTLNKISPVGLAHLTESYILTDKTEDADAILVRSQDMHEMEFSEKLEAIARAGAGVNNIPVDACADKGIVVFNTPGANANAVKELVLCGMLLASRNVPAALTWAKGLTEDVSKTVEKGKSQFAGHEILGKTLGIVGFGHIGQTVSKLGAALGMKILVYSRTKRELPERYQWAELDALFKNADVVSLHCPLTDETRGLVNAERLNLMKPTAFLINTARGAVVDEAALAEALNSGRIAGAGLDVLVHEPPKKDDPLLTAQNCIVTPHIAWASRDARVRLIKTVAENLKAFQNGTPQNVVS